MEHSAPALRELVARTQDGAVVRRLLAIALILEGHPREEAARLCGMDRQVLRDWVHRYNADGVAGLSSRWGAGRPPALNETQMEELRSLIVEGPDLARNGVVRWHCADLRAEIAARWSVTLTEGTVGKLLHRLRMTRLQPRPYHPKKDAVAQETFKKIPQPGSRGTARFGRWQADRGVVPGQSQGGAEGIIGIYLGAGWLTPPMVRDNRHDSVYLFGAICHARAVGAAIIMPVANTEAMNEHLKEISTQVAPGAHAVLVCDGAGWHQQGERLRMPGNITLLPLAPYSPELNPMENIWDYLRGNKLSRRVWDSYEAIVAACKDAWHFLIGDPERINSIARRSWAWVNPLRWLA